MLRDRFGVTSVEFRGLEKLAASFDAGHGVMLAPNHSRPSDPFVVAKLGLACRRPVRIMSTWHIFVENFLQAFLLPRIGIFSINREITDRPALRCAVRILTEAKHPLVMFPEGLVTRTNDHLIEFQRGPALLARMAARQRAGSGGRVVIHPVFLRYRHRGDTAAATGPVLTEIEQRLGWQPQDHLPLRERILKLGHALLAGKEIEYRGVAADGPPAPRIAGLLEDVLAPVERRWLRRVRAADPMARTRLIRTAIVTRLHQTAPGSAERQQCWRDIAHLYFVQQLHCYPPGYLDEPVPADRLLEIVEHFEEDLTDQVRPHPPLHATVWVGDAIPVEPARAPRPDPLLAVLRQRMLELLHQSRS
jgi:1-acyl-sn-glycerol-3-phosphate acyltransferase